MSESLIDRVQLADVAAEVLARESSDARRRAGADQGGYDAALWSTFSDLGWTAILVPEEYGGFGASLQDVHPILIEIGRCAAVGPFGVSSVLSTRLLRWASAGVCERVLPDLALGRSIATVAGPCAARGSGSSTTLDAARSGSTWLLRGTAALVPYADLADVVVAIARVDDGVRGFVIDAAEVSARSHVDTWDRTRRFGTMVFDDVVADPGSMLDIADDRLVDEALDTACYWLACDSAGMAARLVADTAAYGRERVQFDRPIGSFQAWKHYATDMHIAAEAARASVDRAANALGAEETGRACAAAKVVACDAAVHVASWATQLHGGIAYTWEFGVHEYLKRSKLNELLFGAGDVHRDRIAGSLLVGEGADR